MHGADDDASGVCAVLEAARLLANMPLEYTIIFVAFDEEEAPIILSGSKAFADSCYFRNDTLIGMLNLDMIGWDGNNDGRFAVLSDTNSYIMHRVLNNCLQSYQISLFFIEIYTEHWDEGSFQNRGYRAIGMAEESRAYFNPYYHTINETFDKFNIPFFHKMVKSAIATLMTYAMDLHFDMYHKPLTSTTDTSARNTQLYVYFPTKIAAGQYAPRLYYKVINGSYNFVNATSSSGNYYNFVIPGHPAGSKIFYYFAAQDSAGTIAITYPSGGGGISPPGTIPPPMVFSYDIFSNNNQCSVTLPKPINDLQFTYDTIHVNQISKSINRIKINLTIYHPNDGDLIIQLIGPNGSLSLSQGNGSGGSNYINTTFDDSAAISITQGFPPFTGSYKPQNPLSYFNNQPASYNWMLRIYDSRTGSQGSLVSWCVLMQLKNTVSVIELNVPLKYELSQNYPNPFNSNSKIKYQIAKNTDVKLIIYDVLGKEIRRLVDEQQNSGEYEIIFNASDLPSGVYFYQLKTYDFVNTKKLILLK